MNNLQQLAKIFELKGIIESMVELADHDEQYNYPMIEKLEAKMNELVSLVRESNGINV